MTFPTIVSSATSSQTTNTTTHTVTLPSDLVVGNMLWAWITFDARPLASGEIPDNWVQEIGQADGGDHAITLVYWTTVTGGEGSTVEILTDVAQTSAHRVHQLAGVWDWDSVGTEDSAAGSTCNPAAVSQPAGVPQDLLVIAACTIDNGTTTISSYPASYSNTGIVNAGDATDGVSLAYATRSVNTASEDPGSFTLDSSQFFSTITMMFREEPPAYWARTGTKSAGNATATSIAYPLGPVAGQMILAGRSGWRSDITMANETGWTNTAELGGGTGTSIDSHSTKIRVDRKEAAGGESGSVTFDQSGSTNPGCLGIMVAYDKPDSYTWDVATSTGDDATHGANRSVTGSSSISFQTGDVLVAYAATDTDTNLAGFSSPALTASGITFGTTFRRSPASAGVNTGDDGNIELFEATVSSGSGTVAPTLAFTTTTNQCGPVAFVRLRAVSSGVTGTVAVTQAAQTSSTSGQLGYSATAATTQAAQTSSASGTVTGPPTGTVAVTQANQTSTASGQLGYSGTSATTQAAQTSSTTGKLGYSGTAAVTQAAQTSTASGTVVAFGGTVAVTQANQTSTASGQLGYSGTVAATQAAQTSTTSGQLGYSGSTAATQANQTSAASGQLGYAASASPTQANQTSTASGTVSSAGIAGSVAVTQANQTSTATGKLGYSGTASPTQAGQTPAASGQLGYSGTAAAAQQAQTATVSGTVGATPITGTVAVTQASQTAAGAGQLGVAGSLAALQQAQAVTAAGWILIAGAVAALQADQTANGVGVHIPAGAVVTDDITVRASRLARR